MHWKGTCLGEENGGGGARGEVGPMVLLVEAYEKGLSNPSLQFSSDVFCFVMPKIILEYFLLWKLVKEFVCK